MLVEVFEKEGGKGRKVEENHPRDSKVKPKAQMPFISLLLLSLAVVVASALGFCVFLSPFP